MSAELIKITVVVIISAVLITLLRNRLGEYSLLLAFSVIAVVLLTLLDNLFYTMSKLSDLFALNGNNNMYFVIALKALGISYISAFAADICRDYGLSALAQTAEVSGKITIFILSLPLVTEILEATLGFVGL